MGPGRGILGSQPQRLGGLRSQRLRVPQRPRGDGNPDKSGVPVRRKTRDPLLPANGHAHGVCCQFPIGPCYELSDAAGLSVGKQGRTGRAVDRIKIQGISLCTPAAFSKSLLPD